MKTRKPSAPDARLPHNVEIVGDNFNKDNAGFKRLNQDRFPILSEHWGLPPDANNDQPSSHVMDIRFRRVVEKLHSLGPRVTYELLNELGATRQIQTLIEDRTAAFASIDPDALAVTGGDQFTPLPIHEVQT